MSIIVDIQMACSPTETPDEDSIKQWVGATLHHRLEIAELTVRIVDEPESAMLNQVYRKSSGATNVLSFPFDSATPEPLPLIGDLVICAPVVIREAQQQNKPNEAHWAHMVVHGVLHLLGYDHIKDQDAVIMESLETDILQHLGFPPPYSINMN